ncbi:putative RDD family membrane protein YckC [Aneurinibacillus soli]|uniref:RDD family protein n=1 Tax=Aneurinibacillus soli TaxID=1500254 RepID=A0A0U5BAP9_9BACL|nr:RDD family protein [Aneurinibacillus soli]PYE61382.1 putative RDD family membrane protein YckC [Aneurinibacillus soli]BAU27789.1 RDD family protein [Aneurinibacillus soli]
MYAGFWKRFLAAFIDGLIVGIPINIIVIPTSFLFGFTAYSADPDGEGIATGIMLLFQLVVFIFTTVVTWLYFTLMESSKKQATFGKRALGIKVATLNGDRISFGRATGRYFGKILSGIFCIGYIMVAFTEKKQGLHDMMSGCLVVNNDVYYSQDNTTLGVGSPSKKDS